MDAGFTQVPSFRRSRTLLIAGAGLLILFDAVRLWILPKASQVTFTDGFEAVVVLLCAVACVLAAKRSSPVGKGLWTMAAVFFALLVIADFHDFLLDVSFRIGVISRLMELLGWGTYLPLALLVFFPVEKDGRPDWTWLPFLDFLLVTLAAGLAYFRLIYLPHSEANLPWTVFGHAELTRDVLLSVGLLLRSIVDPSPAARGFYRRVGGIFASVVLLLAMSVAHILPALYPIGRPALWLALGIMAACWVKAPDETRREQAHPEALRLALSLFAAGTLLFVVVLALSAPPAYRELMYALVAISVVLFILRTSLAEFSRHKAEIQLQNSEQDYRILFERAVMPILIFEPESERIVQANAAACELYGFPPGGLLGQSLKDFTKDIARGEENLAALLRTGRRARYESLHRTREGKEIDVLISSSVIEYRGQKAVLCFIRDITERKQAEVALAESQARIAALVESTRDMIWCVDAKEFRLLTFNSSLKEFFGQTPCPDVRVGMTPQELLPPELAGRWCELYRQALGKGSFTTEYQSELLGRDLLLSFNLLKRGEEVFGISVFAKDVTERKRAETALQESEKRFRTLIEDAPVAIGIARDGVNLYANEMYLRTFGFDTASELIGRPIIERLAPAWRDLIAERSKLRTRGATVPSDYEVVAQRKDGTQFPLHISVTRVLLPDGPATLAFLTDITDRKRAEEALTQSEQRYKDFISHSADAVWRVELEKPLPCNLAPNEAVEHLLKYGCLAECNDALARIVGLSSAGEILGMRIGEFVTPNDHGRIESFRQVFRQEWAAKPIRFEATDRAGNRKILERTAVPILQDGCVIRIWGTTRDITELKRVEGGLRESEERFRTIFESAGIGIALVDLEGRIIHANRTLQRIIDYTEEELCRMVFTEFTHPEDRDLNWKFYSEMVDGKRSNFEMEKRYIRKDGTVVWVHLTVSLIRNQAGRPKYAVAMVGEITERKRAEEGLVRLGHAIDASGEVIFMTDCRGVITSINPEFTRVYGYTAAEVVGRQTPRILKSGERTEGDYEKFWKSILAKRVVRGDIINKTKDGRMVNMNSSVSPILDDFGRITGFVAIQRDLTERRQLEEQFRQAQKMEAVGRLAGGVAHDFNNLLTIINGYSQLLIEGDILDEAHRTQLIEIRKAGERAASLTKQLLAFSRRQVLEPKVLDLSAVVDGMHKMLSRILGEDVELRILTKGLLGRVKADVTQIEQVILNLAVNARDAMPHGGLLSIEIANAVLDEDYAKTHSTVTPGRYVALAVSDTGIGMDAKTVGRIFEPFYTTKEQGKGTGLGLSTVFGIVKQSGGHINVYSEPGKGTTFRIYLQEVESPAAEAVEAEASRPPGGSETILLVEDEEGVRAIATRVLKDYGYKVLESSSAEDAVRIGDEYRPAIDLLLTDVVMPGLSGRNVAEHLTFSRPGIKVLFMSGYTDDAIIHHGVLEAGVAFLQKPFTPEGLAARVREVLDTPLK